MRLRLCLLYLLLAVSSPAQQPDSLRAFSDETDLPASTRYLRLNYANDFFSATDRYYTQGIGFDYIAPFIRYSPFSYTLIRLGKKAQNYYGLSLRQDCFTPLSIRRDTIFRGERPYAASAFLTHSLISIDPEKKRRLTTRLDLGAIGPCAKCEEEQKGLHKALVNIQPLGWEFQIGNDVVVNYDALLEQGLLTHRSFELTGTAGLRGGTLYNDAGLGLLLRGGRMASYFEQLGIRKNATTRKFQCYLSAQAYLKYVAYNATLQGGVFNRNNVYTLSASQISPLVFTSDISFVLAFKRVSLEYGRTYITREFKNGLDHGWGHVNIMVCF